MTALAIVAGCGVLALYVALVAAKGFDTRRFFYGVRPEQRLGLWS